MMRLCLAVHAGSCIIFTAVLSVIVLKRRLNWLHCTGNPLSPSCRSSPGSALALMLCRHGLCQHASWQSARAPSSDAECLHQAGEACLLSSVRLAGIQPSNGGSDCVHDMHDCAGICLTLLAVVIVSLVNIVYPPPPICPPGDPACLQAPLPPWAGQHHRGGGAWGELAALLHGRPGAAQVPLLLACILTWDISRLGSAPGYISGGG
jgi:hypothetical protein